MPTIERKMYGFVRAGDLLDRKFEIAVYLDGQDVTKGCFCADDELGFIVRYTTTPPSINPATGRIGREVRFGDVQIFACEKEG